MKREMRYIHPGEVLKEDVIEANELSITKAAKLLKTTRANLSNIVNLKSDISPEMALRIAAVFGGTAEIWANMQTKYNLHKAEEKLKKVKFVPYYMVAGA